MKPIKLANSPITYFVSRVGQAEWVLFIHAAFVNHNMFKAQFEYFEDKYNILAIDIIGHGQSTDTQKGDMIDKMAKWVFDILKTENIDKIHIVGVSLGAVLAQLPLIPLEYQIFRIQSTKGNPFARSDICLPYY
mgnify:CR=1 FL=1